MIFTHKFQKRRRRMCLTLTLSSKLLLATDLDPKLELTLILNWSRPYSLSEGWIPGLKSEYLFSTGDFFISKNCNWFSDSCWFREYKTFCPISWEFEIEIFTDLLKSELTPNKQETSWHNVSKYFLVGPKKSQVSAYWIMHNFDQVHFFH